MFNNWGWFTERVNKFILCILKLTSVNPSCLPLYLLYSVTIITWLYSTIYPREMWNIYESVKNEDPRTTNVSEGGNNDMNIAAEVSHPKIVPFIKIIQRINAEHETDLQQFTTDLNPQRRKRTQTVERDDRISNIVNSYHGFNLLDYLRRIGNMYQWILFMFVSIIYIVYIVNQMKINCQIHVFNSCIHAIMYKQITSITNM